MAIEHANITDPEIHEPKGIAAVTSANSAYLSDGAGSGSWQHANQHGGFYFLNIVTPYTLAATTSYQKLAPTTTTTHVDGFTNSTTGRLTYTDTPARHVFLSGDISIDHSAGANRDITLALYLNGSIVTGAEFIASTRSGEKIIYAISWDLIMATNDYVELYAKISTNTTLNIYSLHVNCLGVPD